MTQQDPRQRHAELAAELLEHQYRYHVLDSPLVSDIDYDTMMRELQSHRGADPRAADARLAEPARSAEALDRLHSRFSTCSGC